MLQFTLRTLLQLQKSVPLSLMIVFGLPLRAINLITALRRLSGSNLCTNFICTDLIVRHVNRQHNGFSFLRPIFTARWPKQSSSKFVKAVEASNCSSGRSVITGVIVCALPFLQATYWLLINLKAFLMPGIHIFCWKKILTSSVPSR